MLKLKRYLAHSFLLFKKVAMILVNGVGTMAPQQEWQV